MLTRKISFSYVLLLCLLSIYLFACTSASFQGVPPRTRPEIAAVDNSLVVAQPRRYAEIARVDSSGTAPAPTLESSKLFLKYPAHVGEVNTLAVSARGDIAFSGGEDGNVVRSSLFGSGKKAFVRTQVLLASQKPILALALSPEERRLAIAQVSSIIIYDLEQRRITNRFTQLRGRLTSIAWDPRGDLVAVGKINGDVFVWNLKYGKYAGQNSKEALEAYPGASSPILAINFHPSARSFFAAERDGTITLWRLLRTERELGLRDELAIRDKKQVAKQKKALSTGAAKVESMWLDGQKQVLYVAASDGKVMRWKVRGLKQLQSIPVGKDPVFSVTGMSLPSRKLARAYHSLLLTTGRDQRINFWCMPKTAREEDDIPMRLIQSGVFNNPPAIISAPGIRVSGSGGILWAAQKTGNLLVFNAKALSQNRNILSRRLQQECRLSK